MVYVSFISRIPVIRILFVRFFTPERSSVLFCIFYCHERFLFYFGARVRCFCCCTCIQDVDFWIADVVCLMCSNFFALLDTFPRNKLSDLNVEILRQIAYTTLRITRRTPNSLFPMAIRLTLCFP